MTSIEMTYSYTEVLFALTALVHFVDAKDLEEDFLLYRLRDDAIEGNHIFEQLQVLKWFVEQSPSENKDAFCYGCPWCDIKSK